MLYFSKFRIFSISLVTLIFVYFASLNFINSDNKLFNKKINLGLDLQGGSYLLLEIDNKPVITKKLQNTVTILRKYFKVSRTPSPVILLQIGNKSVIH